MELVNTCEELISRKNVRTQTRNFCYEFDVSKTKCAKYNQSVMSWELKLDNLQEITRGSQIHIQNTHAGSQSQHRETLADLLFIRERTVPIYGCLDRESVSFTDVTLWFVILLMRIRHFSSIFYSGHDVTSLRKAITSRTCFSVFYNGEDVVCFGETDTSVISKWKFCELETNTRRTYTYDGKTSIGAQSTPSLI